MSICGGIHRYVPAISKFLGVTFALFLTSYSPGIKLMEKKAGTRKTAETTENPAHQQTTL